MKKLILQKVSLFVLVVAVMLTGVLGIAGCTDSEKVIRDGIARDFESIKNPDSEDYASLVSSLGQLNSFNIDVNDFIKSWLAGFDYKIINIKVDGDSATVDLVIEAKQVGPIMSTWLKEVQAMQSDPDSAITSVDEYYKKAGESLMRLVDGASTTSVEVTISCQRDGNTWGFSPSAEREVINAMTGKMS
ncbi:MAG: hypothetical protein LBG97_09820 [Coriobacteriales bacterium]|jgi:hypothetical protein|nr:hypothetical protein [Coriobacteriales bacterium]